MESELLPLSEVKTRLHELVRDLEQRDVVLVRYGRPVGALMGFRRYRELLRGAERPASTPGAAGPAGARTEDIARICRARRVRRLVLFGSAAKGGFEPGRSDVDLLVEFEPMPPAKRAEALFGLQDDLEQVLGRSVDLMEDAAVRNPYLREAIDRDHAVLYEAA